VQAFINPEHGNQNQTTAGGVRVNVGLELWGPWGLLKLSGLASAMFG
jgi:hypothetical protein